MLFVAATAAAVGLIGSADVERTDFFVTSEPGIEIFVRKVRSARPGAPGLPVLLLHGARVPGIASFDLPVPGGSLAADLALAGHAVFVMDARGYGRSTRPAVPLVRANAVVRDVDAVVESMRSRLGVEQVSLLGWATGSHWLGYYASLHPEKVSHLVLYNSLYGGSDRHDSIGKGSSLEDPQQPGTFAAEAVGVYRLSTAETLFPVWDRSIPVEDKSAWRDPEVARAYAREALASDATSESRNPPSFRAPSGALEDSFYQATGRQLWDASMIRSSVLVIRSENDFWSRPEDRETLRAHLTSARSARVAILPGATHFAHLDRPERGRSLFLEEVLSFLAGSAGSE
jgi:pimeloyl-ACP methyl ester carboxylesterase